MADRRLGVGQILDDQRGAPPDGLGRVFPEGEEIVLVVEDFDVLHRVLRIRDIGVVGPVDPAIEDCHADAFPGNAGDVHGIGPNGRHAFMQRVVVELLVGVDPFEAGKCRDREELPRSCEGRDHREVVELDDTGSRGQNPVRHRRQRCPGLIEIDDVNRRGVGNEIGRNGRGASVARCERERRGCCHQPSVHGVLGVRDYSRGPASDMPRC